MAAAIVALLIIVAFTGWQLLKSSRDSKMRQNLTGTWVASFGSFTVDPNGSYVGLVTNVTTGRVTTNEGRFEVRSGFLINTVTRSSRTNAHVPYVSHSRILRENGRELAIIDGDEGGNVEHVFRRPSR